MTDGGPAVVLFDVFGTLVDWRGGVAAALRAFGERHGAVADWEAFADDWRAAYAPSMDRVRSGEIGWQNLDALQRVSLGTLLERYGIAGVSAPERERLVRAWHALPAWPDVAVGLRRLREGRIVATLSNGHLALQLALARNAGLSFDTLFSADLFEHYKPDPQTYLGACALVDRAPQRVMLAAAHPADLRAARACGLQTAYIARPLEFGPRAPAPAPAAGEFDIHVDSVIALAEQLEG